MRVRTGIAVLLVTLSLVVVSCGPPKTMQEGVANTFTELDQAYEAGDYQALTGLFKKGANERAVEQFQRQVYEDLMRMEKIQSETTIESLRAEKDAAFTVTRQLITFVPRGGDTKHQDFRRREFSLSDVGGEWRLANMSRAPKHPRNLKIKSHTGAWEGKPGAKPPLTHLDLEEWGMAVKYVSALHFTNIDDGGHASPPSDLVTGFQGRQALNYEGILDKCRRTWNAGYVPVVGAFIHDFETLEVDWVRLFFKRFGEDLRNEEITRVILVPCWDINGDWPEGDPDATRNCYIKPETFNEQMAVLMRGRAKGHAKQVLIAVGVLPHEPVRNPDETPATAYADGLKRADLVALRIFPTQKQGAQWAFEEAQYYHDLTGKPVIFLGYGPAFWDDTQDPPQFAEWSEDQMATFINDTYELLPLYTFVQQIHWAPQHPKEYPFPYQARYTKAWQALVNGSQEDAGNERIFGP